MAALAYHGISPSEYRAMTPGAAQELLTRLEKRRSDEEVSDLKMQQTMITALLKAMGQIAKTQVDVGNALAKTIAGSR